MNEDTAIIYRNEEYVGRAVRDAVAQGICSREDLYVTTKLSPKELGYESAKKAIRQSLDRLGLDYIDLLLIHWPAKAGLSPDAAEHEEFRLDTWKHAFSANVWDIDAM